MKSGFYCILKPTGFTSSDVVVKLRGILNSAYNTRVKIGHFGTLDPGGSGVLVVAIGNATKLFDYFTNYKKTYRAQAVFGLSTDTLDSYGSIVDKNDWFDDASNLSDDFYSDFYKNLDEYLQSFIGKQKQLPPEYSSKSINGVRAYDLARSGQTLSLPLSEIEIYDIDVIKIDKNRVTFDNICSSGTYIRSFVRDLGKKLGVPSYMSYIIRLSCAGFTIDDCVTIEDVAKNENCGFIDLETYCDRLPIFVIDENLKRDFAVGNKIFSNDNKGVCKVIYKNTFLGIGDFSQGYLRMIVSNEQNPVFVSAFDKDLHKQKYSLALGYFDTLHSGHLAIIKELSKTNGIKSVFTFYESLFGFVGQKTKDVFSFDYRLGLFEKLGVQKVFIEKPSKEFLSKTPIEFLDYLCSHINVGTVVCGKDYTFGVNASGNVETLKKYCYDRKITLKVVDEQQFEGIKISSSYIKQLIQCGNFELANKLLGREYSISGTVLTGRKQGRSIGFPTINLKIDTEYIVPKYGVYKGFVKVFGKKYRALINIGSHPTFDDYSVNLEAYLLDFDQTVYGYKAYVYLENYIREIVSFDNVEDLKAQIIRDLECFNE